ncbi:MAG TPA: carbamoyltransferase C-terminal domain-containing protein [Candidatus Omnitrophota bacterium]|nr:carbamoyltransferase C-terminal domain-containing protein [Candidatus Omnitrophota bacterium]HPD84093.1 carbamoyltransferase C-terminal domain-containing protein [Candidatus Omnitrophota bacterium]HRZ02950.1 carbamoyltransferase C-terminal domain-containing protein [Candidatus Omnitrophota bacterium]
MLILGISFGHAAAAALLRDGQIIAAMEEEKISRIKGHVTFPLLAIGYMYKKFNISAKDIDILAIGCEDLVEFAYGHRALNKFFGHTSFVDKISGAIQDKIKTIFPSFASAPGLRKKFYRYLEEIGFPEEKVRLVNHHLAHAVSAYYTSPWDDAAVITNDGKGDGLCGAFFEARGNEIFCRDRIKDLNSVGQFYQSVTKFLGFKINRHEGKITGLAAYGNFSRTFPLMNEIYKFENGKLRNLFHDNKDLRENPIRYFHDVVKNKDFIADDYVRSLDGGLRHFAIGYQLYLNFFRERMAGFSPADMAAGIQEIAEQAIVAYAKAQFAIYPHQHVCLAGGVFANVKINQRIREIAGVKNVYIQPAMEDSGTALGAAIHIWMNHKGKMAKPTFNVYLGPEYTDAQIEETLRKYNLNYKKVNEPEEILGRLIFEGKIIGRFNGALEWGPRALGNRSILARPIDKTINDTLNERLKRTEFMPFAPSMLDEDAKDFLIGYSPDHISAKYMTITYNVNPARIEQIQAAVHVDGTARPQVVFEKDNPSFHKIIKAYKKHSGFGVVINTSFNMHEEPIVNTPEDAIRAFLVGAVDVLSLGNFLVEERPARG